MHATDTAKTRKGVEWVSIPGSGETAGGAIGV
jgi:hypothetical protein